MEKWGDGGEERVEGDKDGDRRLGGAWVGRDRERGCKLWQNGGKRERWRR